MNKGGFAATQITVVAPTDEEERHLPEIEAILSGGQLSPAQLALALKIFRRLAEAEATVHGIAVDEVHFHEVGALDSITDIAGSAIALNLLGVEKFTSSPVAVGSGAVKCAHGVMPVPAMSRVVATVSHPPDRALTMPETRQSEARVRSAALPKRGDCAPTDAFAICRRLCEQLPLSNDGSFGFR